MISDPKVREKVRKAIGEMSASMTRAEGERSLQNETVKALHEEHPELSKQILKKMARVYHKQSFKKERENYELFDTMYDEVLG